MSIPFLRTSLLLVLLAGSRLVPGRQAPGREAEAGFRGREVRPARAERARPLEVPKSDKPTPLVLYIHGGGFQGGRQEVALGGTPQGVPRRRLRRRRHQLPADERRSGAGRSTWTAAAPSSSSAHKAEKWNIDPTRVASTGGSAGAGTSLWLAFHDDLADPKSDDPVARQSTRLTCVAVDNGQSSYDPRFAGEDRPAAAELRAARLLPAVLRHQEGRDRHAEGLQAVRGGARRSPT